MPVEKIMPVELAGRLKPEKMMPVKPARKLKPQLGLELSYWLHWHNFLYLSGARAFVQASLA